MVPGNPHLPLFTRFQHQLQSEAHRIVAMEHDLKVKSKSSSLEHVSNDQAANAPETIKAATTRSIKGYRSELEVAVNDGLQIICSDILPEALPVTQQAETCTNATPPMRIWGLPKKGFLALAIIIVSTLIAALLAVGIKFGILDQKSSDTSHGSSISTASPSSITSPSPSSGPLTPMPVLLNDTSIAAIVTENGDRHLFFQDCVGAIRHAMRRASSNTWATADLPIPLKAKVAKMHTPLAVIPYGDDFQLWFININNTVKRVTSFGGFWSSTDLNITLLAREDSRHLTVTRPIIPEGRDQSTPLGDSSETRFVTNPITTRTEENYYVLYQGFNGRISGIYNLIGYENEWHDVGNSFRKTVGGPNATGPFITQNMRSSITNKTRQFLEEHIEQDLVEVCCVNIGEPRNGSRLRKFSCFFPTNSKQLPAEKWEEDVSYLGGVQCEDCPMERSDAILLPSFSHHEFLGWVNDTKLVLAIFQRSIGTIATRDSGFETPVLSAFFPYTRLAMGNWVNSSFLYHQLDGFTIEENEFDQQNLGWILSTNITMQAD